VYDANETEIWHQTIYVDDDGKSIDDVYGTNYDQEVYLGMIPVDGYMIVEQSYHLGFDVGNWAQGDIMTFDIQVKGEQLREEAWLENKDISDDWKILHGDHIEGTLAYKIKYPTFDFSFTGRAPLPSREYVLVAGPNASDPTIELGKGATDANGDITITGDVELHTDLNDAKVWLVPATNWAGNSVNWPSPWDASEDTFLWETGLISYDDTDL
jgi:hypothetical protein